MYSIDSNNLDVYFDRGKKLGKEKIGNLTSGIEIQCHDKNHKKYYKLRYYDGALTREWGRIGNNPQIKSQPMDISNACYDVEELLQDKYKKGYRLEKDKILHELGIL
jgi:predicted DNA-binding WGR domain protein